MIDAPSSVGRLRAMAGDRLPVRPTGGLRRPVVVTEAMRNPSLAGPDGPAAIRVAASSCARGLGCTVVMNDQVRLRDWSPLFSPVPRGTVRVGLVTIALGTRTCLSTRSLITWRAWSWPRSAPGMSLPVP